jgi:hypothetical protein
MRNDVAIKPDPKAKAAAAVKDSGQ